MLVGQHQVSRAHFVVVMCVARRRGRVDTAVSKTNHVRVTFYHRTTEAGATAILSEGFRDGAVDDLYADWADVERGVWIHNRPVDSSRVCGDRVVVFDLDGDLVSQYRLAKHHPDLSALGWFVPAEVLNREARNFRSLSVVEAKELSGTAAAETQHSGPDQDK